MLRELDEKQAFFRNTQVMSSPRSPVTSSALLSSPSPALPHPGFSSLFPAPPIPIADPISVPLSTTPLPSSFSTLFSPLFSHESLYVPEPGLSLTSSPSIFCRKFLTRLALSQFARDTFRAWLDLFTRKVSIIHLKCAYYVAGAAFNLLSVQDGQQTGLAIHFDAQFSGYSGTIRSGSQLDNILCCIQLVGGALTLTCLGMPPPLDANVINPTLACAGVTPPPFSSDAVSEFLRARNEAGDTVTTWSLAEAHSHLGHRNAADILYMVDRGLLPRVKLSSRTMPLCSVCLTGTINAHTAVSQHHHRATRPLESVD
jgi:hypothetical protein